MNDRSEYRVAKEVALEMLDIIPDYDQGDGPEPHVHTMRTVGPVMLGAHWQLTEVEAAIDKYGIEETGEQAKAINHGLVIIDDNGPLFLATKAESDG